MGDEYNGDKDKDKKNKYDFSFFSDQQCTPTPTHNHGSEYKNKLADTTPLTKISTSYVEAGFTKDTIHPALLFPPNHLKSSSLGIATEIDSKEGSEFSKTGKLGKIYNSNPNLDLQHPQEVQQQHKLYLHHLPLHSNTKQGFGNCTSTITNNNFNAGILNTPAYEVPNPLYKCHCTRCTKRNYDIARTRLDGKFRVLVLPTSPHRHFASPAGGERCGRIAPTTDHIAPGISITLTASPHCSLPSTCLAVGGDCTWVPGVVSRGTRRSPHSSLPRA